MPTLHVHPPFLGVQSEGLQGALLAQALRLVDVFISPVVSGAGIALGVFIWRGQVRSAPGRGETAGDSLCMTLPRASSTAWEVKFSEGIRLMKCFWRFFSWGELTACMCMGGRERPFAGCCKR